MFLKKLMLAFLLLGSISVFAQPNGDHPSTLSTEATTPDNALQHYLHNGDNSYHWEIKKQYADGQTNVYDLLLISQSWRGIKWVA